MENDVTATGDEVDVNAYRRDLGQHYFDRGQ